MSRCARALIGVIAMLTMSQSHAEALRCSGGSVYEGDSRVSVLYKCGQPTLKDSFCAPVYLGQSPEPVPEPFARAYVPCQPIDEWVYDRGPGNFVATVRFRAGTVTSISYGRTPE